MSTKYRNILSAKIQHNVQLSDENLRWQPNVYLVQISICQAKLKSMPLSIAEMIIFAESFTFHREDITIIADIETSVENFKACSNSSATYCKSQNRK